MRRSGHPHMAILVRLTGWGGAGLLYNRLWSGVLAYHPLWSVRESTHNPLGWGRRVAQMGQAGHVSGRIHHNRWYMADLDIQGVACGVWHEACISSR